jgi:hypothetical protein
MRNNELENALANSTSIARAPAEPARSHAELMRLECGHISASVAAKFRNPTKYEVGQTLTRHGTTDQFYHKLILILPGKPLKPQSMGLQYPHRSNPQPKR